MLAAAALAIAFVLATVEPSRALDAASLGCRSSIAKSMNKYVRTLLKNGTKCHAGRDSGSVLASVDCNDPNDPVGADAKGRLPKARQKVRDRIGTGEKSNCMFPNGQPVATVLAEFGRCPSPSNEIDDGGASDGIDDFDELTSCLIDLSEQLAEQLLTRTLGDPDAVPFPKGSDALSCRSSIGKGLTKLIATIGGERSRCQNEFDKGAGAAAYVCSGRDARGKIAASRSKLADAIARNCALDEDFELSEKHEIDALDVCGDTVAQIQSCVADAAGMRLGSGLAAMAYELPDDCRVAGAIRLGHAAVGEQLTDTSLSAGWNGVAHGIDLNDAFQNFVHLDCDADCATCTITMDAGKDRPNPVCRCAGNPATACDTINGPDADDCGALNNACQCNFNPPIPVSVSGVPTCVPVRLMQQHDGTVDIGAGDWDDTITVAAVIHLGLNQLQPCPLCLNDPVANDGQRGGTCSGGAQDGGACDVAGVHPSTGPTSYECLPSSSVNISGEGLLLRLGLSTDGNVLPYTLPCDVPGLCPCRTCSGDTTIGCSSDALCAERGAGTCTNGGGAGVHPNACNDGVCSPGGQCLAGPFDTYCDGKTRADGRGFISCANNADCDSLDAGNCTLTEGRRCYPDPITVPGKPGNLGALYGAIGCLGATGNPLVNNGSGLPGAVRVGLSVDLEPTCASDPSVTFEPPGGSNCPCTVDCVTTTTTTMPGATTTTTLPIDMPCADQAALQCATGDCAAGLVCRMDGVACSCQPALPCAGQNALQCAQASCPSGQECALDSGGLACACQTPLPCAGQGVGQCAAGSCPIGQTCQLDLGGLACSCM